MKFSPKKKKKETLKDLPLNPGVPQLDIYPQKSKSIYQREILLSCLLQHYQQQTRYITKLDAYQREDKENVVHIH